MEKQVKDTIRTYLKDVLILFHSKISDGYEIPLNRKYIEIPKKRTSTGSSWKTEIVEEPEFADLFIEFRKELERIDSLDHCLNVMADDDSIKSQPYLKQLSKKRDLKIGIYDYYIVPYVKEYINKVKGFEYNDEGFNDIFIDFNRSINSNRYFYIAIAPLFNFYYTGDDFHLSPQVKIRQLSLEEINELIQRDIPFPPGWHPTSLFNCIEVVYENKKDEPVSVIPAMEVIDEVISALRIFKSGVVGRNVIISKRRFFQPRAMGHVSSRNYLNPYHGSLYELYTNEVNEFLEFYNYFRTVKEDNKILHVAIDRIGYSQERMLPADRLIDLIIGFESIFLRDSGGEKYRGEMRYRMSERAAFLLGSGSEPKQRLHIHKLVKKAYDQRSAIVHGGSYDENIRVEKIDFTFADFVQTIEEHLRSAIKIIMQEGMPNWQDLIFQIEEDTK